jgi:hypothetical protein
MTRDRLLAAAIASRSRFDEFKVPETVIRALKALDDPLVQAVPDW